MKRTLRPNRLIGLLVAVGALAPLSASAQTAIGSGLGTTQHPVPGISSEVALLRAFQLTFEYGDNHIKKIEVWPNRVPADSDLFDKVRISFADQRPWFPRDRFLYWTNWYLGPLFGAVVQETGPLIFSESGETTLQRPNPATTTFALVGFSLEYRCIDDHHVSRIAVREVEGNLIFAFAGGTGWGGCEAFNANIAYTWLHPLDILDSGTVNGSASQGSLDWVTVPTHGGEMVLTGFDFVVSEVGKDQHLAMLGMMTYPVGNRARIEPYLHDAHGIESLPFDWTIDWVEVGQRYFRPPSPPSLSPEVLRDSEAAKKNAEEWLKRQERRRPR